eukprot:275605-Pelagomonas_calceolata.AAC.7
MARCSAVLCWPSLLPLRRSADLPPPFCGAKVAVKKCTCFGTRWEQAPPSSPACCWRAENGCVRVFYVLFVTVRNQKCMSMVFHGAHGVPLMCAQDMVVRVFDVLDVTTRNQKFLSIKAAKIPQGAGFGDSDNEVVVLMRGAIAFVCWC